MQANEEFQKQNQLTEKRLLSSNNLANAQQKSKIYNCFVILLKNVINDTSLNSLSRDSFAFSQFCHFFILVHLVQFVFSVNKIKIANDWI